jgi:hypothetical protein
MILQFGATEGSSGKKWRVVPGMPDEGVSRSTRPFSVANLIFPSLSSETTLSSAGRSVDQMLMSRSVASKHEKSDFARLEYYPELRDFHDRKIMKLCISAPLIRST